MTDARSFLRLAAIICAIGAALPLFANIGPSDSAHRIVFGMLASVMPTVLLGLAWGVAALRPSPSARVAALGLLAAALASMTIALVGPELAWVASGASVVACGTLALTMLGNGGPLPWAGALLLALGTALFEGAHRLALAPVLADVGAVAQLAGAALLAELGRATSFDLPATASLAAWNQTGDGARFAVLGEQVRMWSVLGLIVLAFNLRDSGLLVEVVPHLMSLAFAAAMFMSTFGLWRMRASPAGQGWLGAARGLATLGASAALVELITAFLTDFSGAGGTLERSLAQAMIGPLLALAFVGLARRVGKDIAHDAKRAAQWYLASLLFSLAMLCAIGIDASSWVLIVLGVGVMASLVVGVLKLADFAKTVRDALPAGAANDAFGDEPGG